MSSDKIICHGCEEVIDLSVSPQFVRAGSYCFHKDHFTCKVCATNLQAPGTKYIHKDGSFYCKKDYEDLFLPTCAHCNGKITTKRLVQALGNHYHVEHFVCKACSKPFPDGKYFEHNNNPFCEEHWMQQAADRCVQCEKPIVENRVTFEGKNFHDNCLVCWYCKAPLSQKGPNIARKDEKIFCRNDFMRLYGKRCAACGKFIEKKVLNANEETYHLECFVCSVCSKPLTKYVNVNGHLRCSEHTNTPTTKFQCGACNKTIETDVVLSLGMKFHSKCFKCATCGRRLEKADAKLRDDNSLGCLECLLSLQKTLETQSNSDVDQLVNTLRKTVVASGDDASSSAAVAPSSQGDGKEAPRERKDSRRHKSDDMSNDQGTNHPIVWKRGELIGKGSFGKVYIAMNVQMGELLAVKQIRFHTDQEKEQWAAVQMEIELMKDLRHPNIVALLGTERTGNKLNILMEYVPGKSLDTLLEKFGPFNEQVIRSYTKQILEALNYCHENKVVHRDIKGKNILVDTQGNLKLADFGSAKRFENALSNHAPSLNYNYTPLWTAPEVLNGDYNSKVDIWSLGCVIIEMATGKPPWSECNFENPFRALYHIGNSSDIPKIPGNLSPLGVEFLKLCLQRDPSRRLGAAELIRHRWITEAQLNSKSSSFNNTTSTVNSTTNNSALSSPSSPGEEEYTDDFE